MKLVPFTIDEISHLRGFERREALREYHKWLNKQRKEDRRIEQNLQNRIYRFQNQEKMKEIRKRSKCLDCGKQIKTESKRCQSCAAKHRWKK